MAQVAADELDARQGQRLKTIVSAAVFPAEGDGGFIDGHEARIGDGGARDVGAQVVEGAGPEPAGWICTPQWSPDLRIDLPVVLREQLAKVLAEGGLQVRQVEQEVGVLNPYGLALGSRPAPGTRQWMWGWNSRRWFQVCRTATKPWTWARKAFVGGELLAEGAGDGGEEQVISLFGVGAEEAGAQWRRESEGDQEVGCLDRLSQFPPDPAVGGSARRIAGRPCGCRNGRRSGSLAQRVQAKARPPNAGVRQWVMARRARR